MSVAGGVCPIATRVHHTEMEWSEVGTVNRDLEAWSVIEPHKAPIAQVWYRVG